MYDYEYWVNWIISDYTPFDYEDKSFFVTTPDRESRFLAERIYLQTYTRALDDGVMSEDDTTKLLTKYKLWSIDDEALLKRMNEELDEMKVQMFNSYTNTSRMNYLRQSVKESKKYISGLLSRKYSFSQLTAKAVAQLARQHYLLGKSIFRRKNKPLYANASWWLLHSDEVINCAYRVLNDYLLEDEDYREIARCAAWRNIWSCKKSGSIFGRSSSDLSIQQRQLVMWSNMYDNIYKSSECPPDCVIDDDDLCDGWLITQRRKRDAQINKTTFGQGISSKIASSEEIYILCSEDKIKNVYDMNDVAGKVAWTRRMKQIQRQGVAKDWDFADVQQKLREQQRAGR